jgi:SNF2 family DNA or RNA helicase
MSLTLKTELKDFQVKTVKWMKDHEAKYDGGLLLNAAGLGKSICILSTVIKLPVKTLIICPAGLVDNWVNEIKKHTDISRLRVVKYYGPNRNDIEINDSHIIYITSYSIVSREFNGTDFDKTSIFRKVCFERIVLDEAHYIRNVYSNISKAIMFLGESYSVNIKKWIVTATPIFNGPNDAFAYFKFLGYEGIDSKKEWTNTISKSLNGFQILNNWIEKYGLTLKKSDVLKELKDKNELKVKLEFGEIEKEFYDALKEYSQVRMKTLVNRIDKLNRKVFENIDGSMRKILHSNVMVYILRLKQACNSPWLILQCMKRLKGVSNMREAIKRLKYFNESKNIEEECPICYDTIANYIAEPCGHKCCQGCWNRMINIGIVTCPKCRGYVDDIHPVDDKVDKIDKDDNINIEEFKHSSKIQKLIEITKNVINKNEKIVIVSQWVTMLKIVKHVFENDNTLKNIKFVSLQGDIPLKNRTDAINQFQNNKDAKICFVSLMSSAEGINLVASNHLVLMDSWWNNAKMTQVMDRIHRIGQKKDVTIYNLQIKNSIEEQIEQLVEKKYKMANLVLNKWNIHDPKNYDDSWMKNIIKIIDKPIEEVE